jgi:hypothetical protein
MKKKKLKKLEIELQEKHHQIWNNGFDAGIQVGLFEAVGILLFQKEQHGNVAGIDDLIKLIKDKTPEIVESYKD